MRFLQERATDAREEMDRPDCDPVRLARTYAQFPRVNAVVSGSRAVYRDRIRPLLSPTTATTLLDVGCGGGDIARRLARWAEHDSFLLDITAIDPDQRALDFATARPGRPRLAFRRAYSSDLVREGAFFDLVISNHMLHHLAPAELQGLLSDSERLATRAVIHGDIARSPAAYALFAAGTLPFFPGSFIRCDGLTSIRRSYTPAELRAVVPPGWTVRRERPFRLVLQFAPGAARG
ncbi:class I SAM-dependent methyltransferase [Arthrobacter sp. STN4]|uniref:class I SAM-dependent methyltransferase n=1 Tax=Arthrobacter sp. STN4 TaxID=2923276 RepID=UPI002119D4F0|nr:class I SAM-dependent methyltransferase [Arthrobacter sp. STN4]MCQ9163460.1 class I SAM-dependent methyltransferase [Arthrobacter sp. STN4]